MTDATQNQKDAFADLLTAACYANPVPNDLEGVKDVDVINAVLTITYADTPVTVPPCDLTAEQIFSNNIKNNRMLLGVFNDLYDTYNRLTAWTSLYFQSPNPPYQQQHIFNLMGTAHSVSGVMNSMGVRPHWDNTQVFSPPSPDDGSPHYLTGGKFNTNWYDDLLGSVSGVLSPVYINATGAFGQLNSLYTSEYNNFITPFENAVAAYNLDYSVGPTGPCTAVKNFLHAVSDIIMDPLQASDQYMRTYGAVHAPSGLYDTVEYSTYTNTINTILLPYPSEVQKFIDVAAPYDNVLTRKSLFSAYMNTITNAIDVAYTTLYNSLSVAFPSMTRPVLSLIEQNTLINAQINREQWWWQPLTADIHFSQYSRASQVAVSGGAAIGVQGMAGVANLNNMINRTASPAIILAKDEVV